MVEPRQALDRSLRAAAAALVVGGLGYAAWSNRRGLAALDWDESGLAFLVAATMFAVAPLVQAVTFVLALRAFGGAAPWLTGMRIWTRSFFFRYAPSGAVGYVYRIRRGDELGAETSVVLKATGLEQLAVVVAGAAVAVAGLTLGGLATLGAAGRRLAGLAALNAAAWLPTGAAVWLLASHLTDAELSFAWLLGAYAVAWLAGFLVPFAPGGLGFREGVLTAFLADPLGAGAAVSIAVVVRLASMAGELVAVGAVEAAARRR